MKKTDLVLLHTPLIGLMYMCTLLGIKDEKVEKPTYEQIKLPILIQVITLVGIAIAGIISNL